MQPTKSKAVAKGLTAGEAQLRFAADGPNELPRTGSRSALKIASEVLREPMLALLLAGGVAYLILGDRTEALILLSFALFSIVLTVVQETRTEHVLEALRDLSAPRAMVIRDGERVRIAGREVVLGDVLVLEQGAPMHCCWRLMIFKPTSLCSPVRLCQFTRRWVPQMGRTAPAVTASLMSIPGRW